jgi:pimeloyl-ACP methyl ester carboxylesterase
VALAYDDAGSGPCVVLIHGHPFNRTLWDPQRDALADRYRVVTPDLRGFGESPVHAGTVTMRELASDVEALLDALNVAAAAVVGLSMGGLVAMELAIPAPERWWALGLVATTAEPITEDERRDRLAMAETTEREGMQPLARRMDAGLFGPDRDEAAAARVMEMMLATDPRGAAAALRGRAQRPDYRPDLAALDVPSFVCVGDRDPWSTGEVTDALVGLLRRPRTLVLPGVGHLPNLEATARFNEELLAFLEEAGRG